MKKPVLNLEEMTLKECMEAYEVCGWWDKEEKEIIILFLEALLRILKK